MSSADTSEARKRARSIGKLTTISVRQAKRRGLYGDGGGLFLQVSERGSKSWIFRFKKAGRLRVMGLGPMHTISLAEARDRARECRKLRLDGIDPIDARRGQRVVAQLEDAKSMSFAECAEAYIAAHRAGWRNAKHAAQWSATIATYVDPVFGDLPVQQIDVALVMKSVEPIWTVKPETASRVRGRIESVLDWATARGYRAGDNPARWRGHLENLLPKRSKVRQVEHHAALPYAELPGFMAELRQQNGVAARALQFAILTAARTGEVIGATWAEIDFEARLWAVPRERMKKTEKEHRVPLSEAAAAILSTLHQARIGARVFPISNMAMLMLLRRMGRADLTVHGFRSTFSDWCAEQTSVPSEVREMALAHTVGDKVEAAYRRGDLFQKRRQLAEAWAEFCASPSAAGGVVPIRAPVASV
jgi:integrase